MSLATNHDHTLTSHPPHNAQNRKKAVLNWVLALTTVLGAAAVEIFAYIQVLGTDACSDKTCPRLGPSDVVYTLIVYGAPAIAVITIVLTFFTARARRGLLVPVTACVLLILAAATLAVTFPH